MRLPLIACLLALAPPAVAAESSLRLSGGPKSENALRKFVSSDKTLRTKIVAAAKREDLLRAENQDPNLRDALTDDGGRKLRVEQLPGMNPVPGAGCAALRDCAIPQLAVDVAGSEQIPEALRQLVRPWMLLQQARRSDVKLTPLESPGDAVLRLELRKLAASPVLVNVTARPFGGFTVWVDRPFVLADLYGRERDALLRR